MDSRIETYKHIRTVQCYLRDVIKELLQRQIEHDESKLHSPEVEIFDEFTPKLADSTYGSDEYKSYLAGMKPALDHHYLMNSHHPEHYSFTVCDQCGQTDAEPCTCGGPRTEKCDVGRMNLIDLIEMLCDWKAATLRHKNGDLSRSIDINQKRFGYSDEMKSILHNTARLLGMVDRIHEGDV